ncbi:hypothetical protein P7C71_g2080, partial [Lecanoromycetidae sp. Uapishka_2]
MGNDKGDTIAQSALKCLEIFKRLPHRQPGDDDTLQAFDLPEDAIVDAQARFRTWIENIVWHIVSGSRSQQTWTSSNESGSLDFSDDEDSDEDDEDDDLATETSSGASSAPTTESHLLYHSILEAITSLLKLSMFIRRSARGNKFVRSSAAQKYETQYDIIHVRDRYPYASENTFLIERLGKANAQRRQWLSYKKRHRDKLALAVYPEIEDLSSEQIPFSEVDTSTDMHDHGEEEDLRPFAQVPELEPDLATTLSSTKASTFYQRDERERAISETDVSETSYSESRYGDIGQETNLVPQPPSEPLQRIKASACPLCDYETMVRRKLDLGVANEPVTTEVMEQTDNDAKSDVANEGEGVMSGQAADSDDSEAVASVSDPEQVNTPSNSDLEGNESTLQMVVGADISGMTPKTAATILDDTNLKSILGTEDTTDDIETTPDLAFVWMPPMDFTPPEAYFEVDDEELVPRREEPMFGGDIYTPGWSASFSRVNAKDVVRLVQTIRTNAFSNFKSVLSQQPRLASSSDYSGRLPLQYAAELGDIDFMQHLLDIYVQSRTRPDPVSFVNEASAKGETALMLAVSQGNEAAVKWLIENQVDVNAADTNGSTALDNAAEAGYVRLAQMLLSHGARPEKAKRYQQTRLRNAALIQKRATNFETIQGLPTETNPVLEDITSLSSLHKAALEGNTDGIKLALVEGVDLEEHATDGRTPLMLAASRGHREAISTLVAAGANIDATSSKGWTTLMNSVRNKNAPVVELLISNGADVNHLSPDRWTALAEAAAQSQTDIMKLLLDCGADPETRSSHDWTPLMHSAYKGDEAAVDLLLNAGADINVTSQHDETALLLAAAGGYARIVRTLLDAGCDPEPLWAKDLYESSTGINDKPGAKKADLVAGLGILEGPEDRAHAQGWTPLMLACQGGHEEIVQMLLYQDVRLEVKSPHGKTAVDIAKENGRMKVARMLDERERQSGNTV